MGLRGLDAIFKPQSIAVVGATEREGSVGRAVMKNLLEAQFPGLIYPVNKNRKEVWGKRAFPSVRAIENQVDLAIIATPIEEVPQVLEDCSFVGTRGAIILSAGGRETGEEGRIIEERIEEVARSKEIRLIGPNCLGIICPDRHLNASFASHMPSSGRLAFISQSGALCTAILDLAVEEKIGFSYFVSIGSMLDVDFGDLIDYFGNDTKVSSIIVYMEGLTNLRKFMSAARSVSQVKPIVVLKAGRSQAGAQAASSHTGAMTGEDVLYDAAFERAGIVRVREIRELFDCAELLAKQSRPSGPKLVVITNAGGPGVMAADAVSDAGLELSNLGTEITNELDSFLPRCWSRGNPIDILGDATPDRYSKTIQTCLGSSDVNGILVILTPQAMTDPTAVAETLSKMVIRRPMPVLACWMGGHDVLPGRAILNKAGIPTYETPEEAVRAFKYLYDYSKTLEAIQQIPPRFSKFITSDRAETARLIEEGLEKYWGILGEWQSMAILRAYGFPVNSIELAKTKEEVCQLAKTMEPPFVMKIASPDILHKTEARGVRLNLTTEDDIAKAYDAIMAAAKEYKPDARIDGVTLQTMIKDHDYELLIGAKQDPLFGPVILFGWGGIFTEILKDRAIGIPPLNRALAKLMIDKTKVSKLLKGYRGRPPADFELLEEFLVRLANLVTDFPQIQELDMNPVLIKNGKPIVADARMILKPSKVEAPMHLIISPYPDQYEWHVETSGGMKLFVRPVRPEDAPLFEDLFKVLSPTSVYFRFFRPMKALPHSLLIRFTQIDYDREIALVAIDKESQQERMLGVARVITGADKDEAEFAVLVGDPWHGKGIGATLLRKCLAIAKERGIKSVFGIVLPENTQMLALGRKLGFTICKAVGGECELRIDLEKMSFEELEGSINDGG
ncbi:MAG: bifunctional acetate--CoA ligase family protein/GNAT family N-acetyltransferase [Syntrophobacterales bacterium]|nr:bifunctional acetate--CoA ligase family protein/GNAT family N-acetyltransferase [Syntrophobacterales bacterium]